MIVIDLLRECEKLGVILAPGENGHLWLSPPGVLSAPLRAQLKKYKEALRQLLTAPEADYLDAQPCVTCGSYERWHWLDGRALCRVCLVLDFAPMTLAPVITREETQDTYPE